MQFGESGELLNQSPSTRATIMVGSTGKSNRDRQLLLFLLKKSFIPHIKT